MSKESTSGGAVCCYLFLLIYGSILLANSLEYMDSTEYIGTLKKADVFGSGDESRVKEYFLYEKNGKNETCVVERLASYANKKKANRAAEKKKLWTTRKIYVSNKHHDQCVDNMSHVENNFTTGIVLLSLFALPIVCVCAVLGGTAIKEYYDEVANIESNYATAQASATTEAPGQTSTPTPVAYPAEYTKQGALAPEAEAELVGVEVNMNDEEEMY